MKEDLGLSGAHFPGTSLGGVTCMGMHFPKPGEACTMELFPKLSAAGPIKS